MVTFFIIVAIFVLFYLFAYHYDMSKIKREVEKDYWEIVKYCKLDPKALQWLLTLNDRFEALVKSEEYKTIKPYDKFALKPPTKCTFLAFMAVDKNKNLKLTVNFEPSKYDDGRTDFYLKYCVGYNHGLKEFIKDCEKKVMSDKIETERIKNVENVINK